MSFKRDTEDAFSFAWIILAFGAVLVVGTLILSILFSPLGVLQKTFEPNNIIHTYEWFHDANGAVNARVAQIKSHKKIVSDTTDAAELSRLRIELTAMQQACRDLTNKYNANADKANRSIFQRGVPDKLSTSQCE
jgi:hypothetical protein